MRGFSWDSSATLEEAQQRYNEFLVKLEDTERDCDERRRQFEQVEAQYWEDQTYCAQQINALKLILEQIRDAENAVKAVTTRTATPTTAATLPVVTRSLGPNRLESVAEE